MSIEEIFKEIALEENSEYSTTTVPTYPNSIIDSLLSTGPNGTCTGAHLLYIAHLNANIEIEYELTDYQTGYADCSLPVGQKLPAFRIKNISQYYRLFNKKKNILQVDCDDSAFKIFIYEHLIYSNLEDIARNSLFEPTIIGRSESGVFNISTSFSLSFPDKANVLRPLVSFYKALIEYAQNH